MDDYQNPKPGKTYISPSLTPLIGTPSQKPEERVRIASKLLESDESYAFADIKGRDRPAGHARRRQEHHGEIPRDRPARIRPEHSGLHRGL